MNAYNKTIDVSGGSQPNECIQKNHRRLRICSGDGSVNDLDGSIPVPQELKPRSTVCKYTVMQSAVYFLLNLSSFIQPMIKGCDKTYLMEEQR